MRVYFSIIIFALLFSCKKLDSEQVFLKVSCEDCKDKVESSISEIEDIYYVDFDSKNETFVFHFEGEKSRKKVEKWLKTEGFINSEDTSVHIVPDCCQSQTDTISKNAKRE